MNDVLHMNIRDNGFYTAVPWALFAIVMVACGWIGDGLMKSGQLGITKSRKLFVIIGKNTYFYSLNTSGMHLIEFVLL